MSQETPAGNSQVLRDSIPSLESPPSMSEKEKTGSPSVSKEKAEKAEIPILPDVEQFWHDRDTVPCVEDNDPIPWEHEDQETGDCDK